MIRWPHETNLRVSYAIFLLERLNNPAQALSQLIKISEESNSLEREFTVFRFKNIIKDILLVGNCTGLTDNTLSDFITYDTFFKSFKEKIKSTSALVTEFWGVLLESKPSLRRIIKIGFKISSQMKRIEHYFQVMEKIYSSFIPTVQLYTHFVLQVFYDRNKAQSLVDK